MKWVCFPIDSNASHSTKAICSLENLHGSEEHTILSVEDGLEVTSGQVGMPLMAMKPHRNWGISLHGIDTIIESSLQSRMVLEGKYLVLFFVCSC